MVIRGNQIAGVHGNGASKEYQTNELHTHERFSFCLLLLLLALVAPVAPAHSRQLIGLSVLWEVLTCGCVAQLLSSAVEPPPRSSYGVPLQTFMDISSLSSF